jgi:uncharacterized repeat protein (TIGR01451 family)
MRIRPPPIVSMPFPRLGNGAVPDAVVPMRFPSTRSSNPPSVMTMPSPAPVKVVAFEPLMTLPAPRAVPPIVSNLPAVLTPRMKMPRPLPNLGNGIETIGGGRMRIGILDDSTGANTIAYNGANGIRARNGGPLVFGNSIHDNGGLGIANDTAAPGTPVMTVTTVSATAAGGTRIQGTLAGVFALNDYTVQAYANTTCDPSGSGEGELYLGSSLVQALTAGTAAFDVVSAVPYVPGRALVTTVSLQNPFQGLITTSNFSACKLTGSANVSTTLADAPDPVDQGQQLTYTAVVANAGPDTALFGTADLTLPADATFIGVTTTQGTCSGSRGSAHCTLGTLANGASVTIVARVRPVSAGTASASASAQFAVDDPSTANNSASTTTTVQPATLMPLTFTVDSAGDAPDATPGDTTCATATGVCTLRAALEESNLHPSKDTIAFAIGGSGVQTIAPFSSTSGRST